MENTPSINELINTCNYHLTNKDFDKAEEVCSEILKAEPENIFGLQKMVYILRAKNQYKEALKFAEEQIKKYPKDAILLGEKAMIYFNQQQYKEALEYFNKSLDVNPSNEFILTRTIESYRMTGNYKEAKKVVEKAIHLYPKSINIMQQQGWYFYNIEKYNDAIKIFDKILNIDSTDITAKQWKIASLRKNKQYEEAKIEIDNVLNIEPYHVGTLLEYGWLLYSQKNYIEAIKIFDDILSIEPGNFLAKQWKASTLRLNKQFIKAKQLLDDILIDQSKNTDIINELGWLHYDQKNYKDAITEFNKVLSIDANNPKAVRWKIASLRKNGQFEEAKEEIDKALQQNSENGDVLNELGWLQYDNHKYQEAIETFNHVLSFDKENSNALLWKISALRKLKQLDTAKKEIDNALSIVPDNVEILNELGWYYYDKKDYQSAQETFRKVLKTEPNNDYAIKWRVISLRLLRQFDEALKLAEHSKQLIPDINELLIQEAYIYIDIHNNEKAIGIFKDILKSDDKNEDAYIGLILAYQLTKDIPEAEKIISAALKKFTHNSRIFYQIYWFYNEQGNYTKADEYLSEAIKVDPSWTQLYVNRAEVLNKLNKNFEAIQLIQYVQKTYPEDLDMHEGVGWYYLGRNQALKARKEFEYILSKQPNNIFGLNGIGGSYFFQERYTEAEDYFRQVIELDKESAVFHNNLAWALLRQNDTGKYDEVHKHASIALKIDPNYDSAIGCLGILAFKKGNLLESEDYFLRSIQLSPSRGSYVDLGALYSQTGRDEDAETNLKKAIQYNRNDERAYIELGNLYLKQGKVKDAIKQFKFSRAIAPKNGETHNALAIALNEDGNFKEAEETLRSAIRQLDIHKLTPLHLTLSSLLVNMGDNLGDKQLYEDALQETNKAKKIKTNNPDAYFHSGIARFKLEDYRGSVKDFKECLKLDKHNFEAERNIRRLQTLLQSEQIRSRGSMLAGFVVGAISIVQIIILWVFYFMEKINENVLLVMLPILLGLTVIAFLLPWLIKIKLPGIEAELSQPTKSISSGPIGEINFASSTTLIKAGPQ